MASKFTPEEHDGLTELFGVGLKDAEDRLEDDPIVMPDGVTKDALERYREIAEDAIQKGKDKTGVQKKRLEIIDKLLSQLQ